MMPLPLTDREHKFRVLRDDLINSASRLGLDSVNSLGSNDVDYIAYPKIVRGIQELIKQISYSIFETLDSNSNVMETDFKELDNLISQLKQYCIDIRDSRLLISQEELEKKLTQ